MGFEKHHLRGHHTRIDQKVCLNLVKLDQLCAIALMKRKEILKALLKMVAMATSHGLWRFYLIALMPTILLFYKTRFDFQTSISCRFLFCSIQ